jgi:hypothetical protein
MLAGAHHCRLLALAIALSVLPASASALTVSFLHKLSTLDGVVPFSGAQMSFDGAAHELLVYSNGRVRIFNASGMEVFSMGDSPLVGHVAAVEPTEGGDLIALSWVEMNPVLLRLNFRGEFLERLQLTDVPPQFQPFRANVMRYRGGRVYLADLGAMRILVTDERGKVEKSFDVAELLGVADRREQVGIKGFNVDPAGNMLFTVQELFRAHVLALDGTLRPFGQKGSAPGKFNVVSGIAADERGFHYVADLLKSAVLVFDRDLRFVKEFGGRGGTAGNLVSPVDVAAGDGKVFVSQYGSRGISVFKVDDAAP